MEQSGVSVREGMRERLNWKGGMEINKHLISGMSAWVKGEREWDRERESGIGRERVG